MKNACLYAPLFLAALAIAGCASESDSSSDSSEPQEKQESSTLVGEYKSTPVKVTPNYTEGGSCNTNAMACDGNKLVTCSKGVYKVTDCAFYNATCEVLAGTTSRADCFYDDDETCDEPGRVREQCEIETEEETDEEMLVTRACIMASNGKAYPIKLKSIFCSSLCKDGCTQIACDSTDYADPVCSGNIKTYCYQKIIRTVNCETSGGTCEPKSFNGKDECHWPESE